MLESICLSLRRTLIFAVGPFLVYLSFQVSLGLTSMYIREFTGMRTDDNYFPFHVISFLHIGAILLPLVILGARKLTKADFCILVWTGLYILSLWMGRTSGWDRFYLAVISPLAMTSRHGLVVLKEQLSTITVSIGIVLYAFVNYCALLLNIYQ
jgi:hypothetical protein